MSNIQIRPALLDDSADIAALLGDLGYPVEPDEARARLERISEQPHAVTLVAVRDGQAVGLCGMFIAPFWQYSTAQAVIVVLVVRDGLRGQGIGRNLLDAAEHVARSRGALRISLSSGKQRAAAHQFYLQHGYTIEADHHVFIKDLPDS